MQNTGGRARPHASAGARFVGDLRSTLQKRTRVSHSVAPSSCQNAASASRSGLRDVGRRRHADPDWVPREAPGGAQQLDRSGTPPRRPCQRQLEMSGREIRPATSRRRANAAAREQEHTKNEQARKIRSRCVRRRTTHRGPRNSPKLPIHRRDPPARPKRRGRSAVADARSCRAVPAPRAAGSAGGRGCRPRRST